MFISLISPLNLKACVAQLEQAKELEQTSFSSEHNPLNCDVNGRYFTLKKRHFPWVPFMQGELSETPDGTVITYSMGINPSYKKLELASLILFLPFPACCMAGQIINGLENGFTLTIIPVLLIALSIPALFYWRKRSTDKAVMRDKNDMLDFLQKTLNAKPRY